MIFEKKTKEYKQIERASGSKDTQNHGEDNPESTIEPKRKPGRPSTYTKTDEMRWKNKKLKTLVNEFNTITVERVELNKAGKKKTKAYTTNGNEMTRVQMIKIITGHNKTVASQATRGM